MHSIRPPWRPWFALPRRQSRIQFEAHHGPLRRGAGDAAEAAGREQALSAVVLVQPGRVVVGERKTLDRGSAVVPRQLDGGLEHGPSRALAAVSNSDEEAR